MMKQIKKRYITLIEIMIVMFLIALITGALAYRFGGALEKGYAFKTKANIERLDAILNLGVAEHPDYMQDIQSNWKRIVDESPLVKDPESLKADGWGVEFKVGEEDGKIEIHSDKYDDYLKSHPSSR
jgi:general secretion pathway protein G